MCFDKAPSIVKISNRAHICLALVILCLVVTTAGHSQQVDTTAEEKWNELDKRTGEALRHFFKATSEYHNAMERVRDPILIDPEVRSLYLDLLAQALEEPGDPDDWTVGFVIALAPEGQSFLSLMEPEMQPGGRFENALVGKHAKLFIEKIEGDSYRREPDLSVYTNYIRHRPADDCSPVIAYLVMSSPNRGMEILLSRYAKEIEDLPEVYALYREIQDWIWLTNQKNTNRIGVRTSAPVEQLFSLSKRDEWWVRLYVAQQCKDHPVLRTGEVVVPLSNDPNSLIRETIGSFTPGDIPEPIPLDQK